MRMEPDDFLDLLERPDATGEDLDSQALEGPWVAYHPTAGVFLGFLGDDQMWSKVSPMLTSRVVYFAEPELGSSYLSQALDTYGFDSNLLEMYQVADGTWPAILAVGLPVEDHVFDVRAALASTHAVPATRQ